MRAPDKFTAYLLELLTPLGPVAVRRMFGGAGLFLNGSMFGLIVREDLFFKVNDINRAAYEAAGESPFSYDTRNGTHTLTSYWHCPPHLLDEPEAFRHWARQAIDAALAEARRKPRKRKPSPRGA